ncbi:MAG: hypothetical protein J6D03_01465 [Clostridia bacterium]|nr:hypothetical protein [Clostridia bacterium]
MIIPVNQINLIKFTPHGPTEQHYTYKDGIKFEYNYLGATLTIKTTTDAVLEGIDIKVGYREEYMKRLKQIIKEVIGREIEDRELILNRIDYKVDIKLSDSELKIFKQLKDKHNSIYKGMSKKENYETSVHLDNENGQTNINSYSKFDECKNVKYWNIWRVEVQVKQKKLYNNLTRYGIERTLDNYWSLDNFNENYFDFLQDYFFLGDYHRLDICREKIKKSTYSKTVKKNLCQLVTRINRMGMTETKKKYGYNYMTWNKYIGLLNDIGVNPVTIDMESEVTFMENILSKSRKLINENYFV